MKEFNAIDLIEGGVGTSSKGNQRKWRTRDGSLYIKECFVYQGKTWRDDLVEIVSSKYAGMCKLDEFNIPVLEQYPCTVDGRPAVYSENFCANTQVFISFKRLCDRVGIEQPDYLRMSVADNYSHLCTTITSLTGLNWYSYMLGMAVLDTIAGNEDRHYNNFGVLYDNTTQEYDYAPLFDFGLGLFEHDNRYENVRFKECLPLMQCKPFALDSQEVADFLMEQHADFLKAFLPESVDPSVFVFPSEKAETYFRNRNILLGVKLYEA